jgi:hypothetical protein
MMGVFRFFTLRRLRLLSGMVMFFYIAMRSVFFRSPSQKAACASKWFSGGPR